MQSDSSSCSSVHAPSVDRSPDRGTAHPGEPVVMIAETAQVSSPRAEVIASHLTAAAVLVLAPAAAFSGAALSSPLYQAILRSDLGAAYQLLLGYAVLVPLAGALLAVLARTRFLASGKRVCALWGSVGAGVVITILALVLGGLLLVLQPVTPGGQTRVQEIGSSVKLWLPLIAFATYLMGSAWAVLDRRRCSSSGMNLVVLGIVTTLPGGAAIALTATALQAVGS